MRILHCCLSCFYIDGYAYQENILPRLNAEDGHEVLIIASTETYIDGKIAYIQPSEYMTEYGVRIVRIPYAPYLPGILGKKLRVYPEFAERLEAFSPDVILFHGACAQAITVAAKYRRNHSDVRLYVDSHEAFYNSATNIISKWGLHILFYRRWYRKALGNIDKVLYIGLGEKEYMKEFMGTPESKLEYYPLGGHIILPEQKAAIRGRIREELHIHQQTTVFVHSGKMDLIKRTIPLMKAFSEYCKTDAVLLIIGIVLDDIKNEFELNLSLNDQIRFLGWKSPDSLKDYICAADMYLQPGGPSATLQMALCCGIPVLIRDESFYNMFSENGCAYPISDDEDLQAFFTNAPSNAMLSVMSDKAYRIAHELLDYRALAARLYR